jgi:hypothetical protein
MGCIFILDVFSIHLFKKKVCLLLTNVLVNYLRLQINNFGSNQKF